MPTTTAPLVSTSFEAWFAGEWKLIALVLCVVLSLLWLWWRTGSSHLLITLLLRWLLGKRNPGASLTAEFLEQRTDLMHFRAVTGVRGVPTREAAERLVQWARRHDLDMDVIGRAGRYLDARKPALRPMPRRWWVVCAFLCGLALSMLSAAAGTIGALAPPVLRVVKTGTPYAVDGEKARRFQLSSRPRARSFSREDCADRAQVASKTGYAEHDVDVICDVLLADLRTELRSALIDQRFAAGVIVLLFAFWGAQLLKWVREAWSAHALHEQIADAG